MKIGSIIHQQVMQLKWHFLACLGLVMALPIQEGFINVRDGAGFYATGISLGIPLAVMPLLWGLIACANVQADLDDRRYIFWRSKPAGVRSFIALKYIVGFLISFVVFALPVLFAFVSQKITGEDQFEIGFSVYIVNMLLISLLSYSLCFFCNTLIRKTARGWLIGMAGTCFLLLVPFVLPLSFKDITSDFLFAASMVYLSITVVASLVALVASLIAASRNWHLRTNLKGLLWAGAAMVFLVMMLFTGQVANIKVLDEIEIPKGYHFSGNLKRLYSTTQQWHFSDVDTSENRIELRDVYAEPSEETAKQLEGAKQLYSVGEKGLGLDIYPTFDPILHEAGGNIYDLKLNTYTQRKEIGKNSYYVSLKKAYLCSYQMLEGLYSMPVSALDLSDCIVEGSMNQVCVRQIEDKLVVFIQDSIAVVQIKGNGELELIDKKINGLKGYSGYLTYQDKIFVIPLVPVPDVSIEERVKLTIDVNYRYHHAFNKWRIMDSFSHRSLVDINGDDISYCLLDEDGIQRYDVFKWDEKYVYCRFRDERAFTFLEQMFGQVTSNDPHFVQDGKLYAFQYQKLMVFDIRSDRIRKLGHFERLSENYFIRDIEVLVNGNILLGAEKEVRVYEQHPHTGRVETFYDDRKSFLILLKNPD